MSATNAEINKALTAPHRTSAEYWVIMWQFRLLGNFHTALFDAIKLADEENLRKLELGFPNEVQGFRDWAFGGMGSRLRTEGLNI